MGHIISAKCECGYHNEGLRIGSGARPIEPMSYKPVLCREGKHVVSVNTANEIWSCPDGHEGELILYPRKPLPTDRLSKHYVSDSGGYKIGGEGYLCPKCDKFSLIFSEPLMYFD